MDWLNNNINGLKLGGNFSKIKIQREKLNCFQVVNLWKMNNLKCPLVFSTIRGKQIGQLPNFPFQVNSVALDMTECVIIILTLVVAIISQN